MQMEIENKAADIPALNDDCLVHIFKKCTYYDLISVRKASAHFAYLVDHYIYKPFTRYLPMVAHHNEPSIMQRSGEMSYAERYEVGHNWQSGECSRPFIIYGCGRNSLLTMHLDRDCFYVTVTSVIRKYRRNAAPKKNRLDAIETRCSNVISTGCNLDIVDFVKKGDTIFEARYKYSGFIHENNTYHEMRLHAVHEQIHCVDFTNDIYVSGSTERCKIWKRSDQYDLIHLDCVFEHEQAYKVLRFNDNGSLLFGGCRRHTSKCPVHEINVETGVVSELNVRQEAVNSLKLKDESTFFCTGNLPHLQLYDRRTQNAELFWHDRNVLSFNCIEYDGLNGILCSTGWYRKVNLFDLRKPGNCIQSYTPFQVMFMEEPGIFMAEQCQIYSIVADSRYLFCALKDAIFVYDFKTSTNE